MKTREISRTELKGGGYLAIGDGRAPQPGIVVIHEAYGLNDQIKDVTRKLADSGYAALTFRAKQSEVDVSHMGAIGFCMGGGFAVAWACTDSRLKVIAPFYATNPRPLAVMRRLCPVVGSYPGKDFTTRSGKALERELDRSGIAHDIKIYPDTRHSFFNDRGPAYNKDGAEDSWRRVIKFFGDQLQTKQ